MDIKKNNNIKATKKLKTKKILGKKHLNILLGII